MQKSKMPLLTRRGQILIEAIISCLLMTVIMVAFAKLIELKKSNKPNLNKVHKQLEDLNAANDSAK
jgi:Tfp pilus assembly protein PilV